MRSRSTVLVQVLGWCIFLILAGCGVLEQAQAPTPVLERPTLSAALLRKTERAAFIAADNATMFALLTPNPTRDAIDWATFIARPTRYVTPYPSRTPGPSPIPGGYNQLYDSGFLADLKNSRFNNNNYNRYTSLWSYDYGDRTIEVAAGAQVFQEGPHGPYRLEEPYQGLLQPGRSWMDEYDNLHFGEEDEVILPVRDGPARVVDAHVQGDQMLLTVTTAGGSVYVYNVLQRTLSAPQPPTLDAGGPYVVAPGGSLKLAARGQDAAAVMLEYTWDLDGDGVFEKQGRQPTFDAQSLPEGTSRTVTVRVASRSGLSATAQAHILVQATAPTLTP